jgi:hypothetical protein
MEGDAAGRIASPVPESSPLSMLAALIVNVATAVMGLSSSTST